MILWAVIGVSVWGSSLPESAESVKPVDESSGHRSFAEDIKPFFEQYCYQCHDNDRQKAGINFEEYGQGTRFVEERKHWKKVIEMLAEREMPPDEEAKPPERERKLVVDFIRGELAKFDCSGRVNPGHVTIRRLNRNEYENTVRDLLSVEYEASESFPADEVGYGFDNIGSVLSLPPMLMEKYLNAAESIAKEAIGSESKSLSKAQKRHLLRPGN